MAGNSEHQRSVQLPPDYSFEPPPSISSGSASAYTGNLTVEMLHEICARISDMAAEMDLKWASWREIWPRHGERGRKKR